MLLSERFSVPSRRRSEVTKVEEETKDNTNGNLKDRNVNVWFNHLEDALRPEKIAPVVLDLEQREQVLLPVNVLCFRFGHGAVARWVDSCCRFNSVLYFSLVVEAQHVQNCRLIVGQCDTAEVVDGAEQGTEGKQLEPVVDWNVITSSGCAVVI